MRFNRLLTVFLASLMLFSFASCNNTPENRTGSLNIHVSDTVSKVIGYDAEENGFDHMSHYSIQVLDSKQSLVKETDSPFALTDGEGEFVVSGLVTGTYTINATGYIYNGTDYMPIATGTATEYLGPSIDKDVIIAIDDFVDGYVESIIVDLVMPIDCIVGNAITGTLNWTISGLDEAEVFSGEETLTAEALTDGKYTLLLDEDLPGGRYLLTVSFTDAQNDVYTGVDALIAYPGLPAAGAINIDSRKPFDKPFTVTDGIGEELVVGINDGEYSSADGTFVVTFTTSLEANQVPIFTVDGVYQAVEALDGSYTLTGLQRGVRNVSIIVYDTQKKAEAGSLVFTVNVISKPTIKPEEKPVTVSYYDLAKNLELGDNEINMGFTKDGKEVEFPYSGYVTESKALMGDGEYTYDMFGLEPITGTLTDYFDFSEGMVSTKKANGTYMAFEDYPSAYIAFPSSVAGFGNSAMSGFSPLYKTKPAEIREIVFDDSLNNMDSVSFMYMGFDWEADDSGSDLIPVSQWDVSVYLPGLTDTALEAYFETGAVVKLAMLTYSANISSMHFSEDSEYHTESGFVVHGKNPVAIINSGAFDPDFTGNSPLSVVMPEGTVSLGNYLQFAPLVAAPSFAYENKCSVNEAMDSISGNGFSIDVSKTVKTLREVEALFALTGKYEAFESLVPQLEIIGNPESMSGPYLTDEVPESADDVIYHFENLDFKEANVIGSSILSKYQNSRYGYTGFAIERLALYGNTQIAGNAFYGVKCDTLDIYGDIILLDKEGIFSNTVTNAGWGDGILYQSSTDVTFHEGVTSIPDNMFNAYQYYMNGVTQTNISHLSLPESLESIGSNSFSMAYFEEPVLIIPDNVQSIGILKSGLSSNNLQYIYIPDSVVSLPDIPDGITVYKESEGWTLEKFAETVGITIPEGFTGGTLPLNS